MSQFYYDALLHLYSIHGVFALLRDRGTAAGQLSETVPSTV